MLLLNYLVQVILQLLCYPPEVLIIKKITRVLHKKIIVKTSFEMYTHALRGGVLGLKVQQ